MPSRPTGLNALARNRGFVLVTMMLSLVVLLAFLGLAVDVGYVQHQKTRMQTAADAAALGGVQEIRLSGATALVTAAKADAALNGFTDGQNAVSIAVNSPPASGYYTSDSTGVEVVISQDLPTFFMQLVGSTSVTVRARAVARQGAGTSCLYTLDPSASNAFSASGGVTVQVGCGVIVDSTSSQALVVSGGAHVTATSVSVAGNYSISGGAVVSPTPTAHAPAQSDPLSYVAAPAVGACNYTNYSASGGAVKVASPGVYCNGISISGGSRVTFNPGTYILKGGGLAVSGGSIDSGAGVTFYNTAGGGYTYQAISISGGTTVNLSAPTTGGLAGILFFQDRSIVSGTPNSISGGSSTVLTGTLYFPTTPLNYSGGSSATGAYTIIVAKTVNFSGGSTINADYSSLPGGSPVKGSAALSE
jgi:Flp pilus assembly protein TadG